MARSTKEIIENDLAFCEEQIVYYAGRIEMVKYRFPKSAARTIPLYERYLDAYKGAAILYRKLLKESFFEISVGGE